MTSGALPAIVLGTTVGLAAGIGGFTFIYARGASYLTNDPAACANCHVMGEYHDGWIKSSHRSAAACADCHMPYHRVGALKISDHHVRSPLLDPSRACGTCHRWGDEELRARAYAIQDRTHRLRDAALDAIVGLIADLKAARAAGKAAADLAVARDLQRHSQFRVDFVEAENSVGFHAPQEAARILAVAIDLARQGQIALRDPSFKPRLGAEAGAAPSEKGEAAPPAKAPSDAAEKAGAGTPAKE